MEIPKAGPELDALIEKIIFKKGYVLPYSRDIEAAWKIVERLRDLHAEWTAKLSEVLPEATKRFSEMSEEMRISYGNDVEEFAAELVWPKPFDFEVFFNKIHRFVDRRWPYCMLYATPEIICRAAVAAFPVATSA